MTEPISDEDLERVRRLLTREQVIPRGTVARLLARLDAAEAAAVPNGWEVVRVDGIPYLTPDRIRPLTEGEASDA